MKATITGQGQFVWGRQPQLGQEVADSLMCLLHSGQEITVSELTKA